MIPPLGHTGFLIYFRQVVEYVFDRLLPVCMDAARTCLQIPTYSGIKSHRIGTKCVDRSILLLPDACRPWAVLH